VHAGDWILRGFIATVLFEIVVVSSQALGLTRLNMPFMLGTMVTNDRDRARAIGLVFHFGMGWLLALVYLALFAVWGKAGIWRGAAVGLVHALFVLGPTLKFVPSIHPRMASEEQGPTPMRQLEPPGFLATNYGWSTPIAIILSHIVYGAVLGVFGMP
jgi:uncharacterized membrane protein YagU involved in acid resistance